MFGNVFFYVMMFCRNCVWRDILNMNIHFMWHLFEKSCLKQMCYDWVQLQQMEHYYGCSWNAQNELYDKCISYFANVIF
jgi:hypothetical protein